MAVKRSLTSGSKTTAQFRLLRPALREWTRIIAEYVHQHKEPPYHYGSYERVNCGLLAAALWRKGITALHEIEVDRWGTSKPGRADLDLLLGNEEFFLEAKMGWLYPKRGADAATMQSAIQERLRNAAKYTGKYVRPREDWVAIVFVVPGLRRKPRGSDAGYRKSLEEFVRAVKSVDADIRAWILPRGYRPWPECKGDGKAAYFYPAVAIVGTVVPYRKPA
jgi:hypothetical protein